MKLTRDPANGRILDSGTPIVLRGGHFDLFEKDGTPGRGLFKPGETNPFVLNYNRAPCPPRTTFPVNELKWDGEPWTQLFSHITGVGQSPPMPPTPWCNLVRVWLTNGTRVVGPVTNPEPIDVNPFKKTRAGSQWKFQVYDAVVNDVWNEAYFARLRRFAELADQNGVALQISLFNYFDFVKGEDSPGFRGWCRSPWNSSMCLSPANERYWGNTHLVELPLLPNELGDYFCQDPELEDVDTHTPSRQIFFLAPNNGLRQVQAALVTKVVKTLRGLGNVILEIMNEPRAEAQEVTNFNSKIIDFILAAAGNWRPLISVNATSRTIVPGVPAGSPPAIWDVDWWKDRAGSIPNYDKVDLISYHGTTGYPPRTYFVCNRNDAQIPDITKARPQMRLAAHEQRHSTKALMFSTDAARIGSTEHIFPSATTPGLSYGMHVRDGQITTNLANDTTALPQAQWIESDLQNWAYWCLSTGMGARTGKTHFHNHAGYQATYRWLRDAFTEAVASPLGPLPPDAD